MSAARLGLSYRSSLLCAAQAHPPPAAARRVAGAAAAVADDRSSPVEALLCTIKLRRPRTRWVCGAQPAIRACPLRRRSPDGAWRRSRAPSSTTSRPRRGRLLAARPPGGVARPRWRRASRLTAANNSTLDLTSNPLRDHQYDGDHGRVGAPMGAVTLVPSIRNN